MYSEKGRLLASCRIEREKFYPGPGFEPVPLALRASALTTTLSRTSLPIHDRINLLEPSFLTSGPTNSVVITSYRGMHSQTLECPLMKGYFSVTTT